MKRALPLLVIILGLFLLLCLNQPLLAIAVLTIGIVMILEKFWPEEWSKNEYN